MEFKNSQNDMQNDTKTTFNLNSNYSFKGSQSVAFGGGYSIEFDNKIGSGSFGEIYICTHLTTLQKFAVKIETLAPLSKRSILFHEMKIIKYLQGGIGIPKLIDYVSIKNTNYLVMELLGINLTELFLRCNKHFSLDTLKYLAINMLNKIEYLHLKHLVHRDIKPENFTLGGAQEKPIEVYLIDFGLTKKFIDKNLNHISIGEGKPLIGTARYASINTHLGYQQSRRDDLESFIYVFLFFLRGSLPWQQLRVKNKQEKYKKILEIKIGIADDVIDDENPNDIINILKYVRNLKFDEKPDYKYLRQKFMNLENKECKNMGINEENLDWIQNNIDIFTYFNSKDIDTVKV